MLLFVLLDHRERERLLGTLELVEHPATHVGDETARLRRGQETQIRAGGARMQEGVVELVDLGREQTLPPTVAATQEPEVFLLTDVRQIPDERAHQGRHLRGQLGVVEIGQRERARARMLQTSREILTHRLPPPVNATGWSRPRASPARRPDSDGRQ